MATRIIQSLILVLGFCLIQIVHAQQNLPRNIRPVICKAPGTDMDLCVNADCMTVAPATTACICRQGTVPNQFSPFECLDLDECVYFQDVCRAGAYGRCINELGDYRCECNPLYYRSAGKEHYCEALPFMYTPLGQMLNMRYSMDM